MSIVLRVTLFREGRFWLAQGLEHDVGVQGEDLKDLMRRLVLAIEQEGEDLVALPPAPKYFQDLWPLRSGLFEPEGLLDGLTDGIELELGMVA